MKFILLFNLFIFISGLNLANAQQQMSNALDNGSYAGEEVECKVHTSYPHPICKTGTYQEDYSKRKDKCLIGKNKTSDPICKGENPDPSICYAKVKVQKGKDICVGNY